MKINSNLNGKLTDAISSCSKLHVNKAINISNIHLLFKKIMFSYLPYNSIWLKVNKCLAQLMPGTRRAEFAEPIPLHFKFKDFCVFCSLKYE
jgi:hypothetical protein